ncbi:hypothetical protein [Nitrobacter vulgaris]|uniref:hypothetical protein n=1 Tax=Nitrobacter vulgaris TaxID=29421 RepID=UPI001116C4D2|nr:hypothetical protein [Nitrobacter vulgaris]
MREIWLKNAQHDCAHEGECDVGDQDAHVARESHATSRHLFVVTQRPAIGSSLATHLLWRTATAWLKMTENNTLKKL